MEIDYSKVDYENGYIDNNGNFVYVENFAKNMLRISELKRNLSNTDYKALKYIEGGYTEEQYAEIKKQRQMWRDEINKIEKQMGGVDLC